MKTLIIDAATVGSMDIIHGRFYAAFDFPECYGETLDSLHDYLGEINTEAEIKILNNSALEGSIGEKDTAGLRRVLNDSAAENPNIHVEFLD